jgi:hypothetical protein
MSLDVKKLTKGSVSLAVPAATEVRSAASSSVNESGGAMKSRTRVLLAVEKAATPRRVRWTASWVRY